MNYTELINVGLKLLAAIISIIITCKVKPWLEEKIGKEKLEISMKYVTSLVAAAEQMLKEDDPDGTMRKRYVIEQLTMMGYEITEQLNAIIEAEVWKLNQDKKVVEAEVKGVKKK